MRSIILTLLLASTAFPAILPETIGHWKRGEPTPGPIPDGKVWAEYSLQDAETSPYSDAGRKFTISAYRFTDSTGALAAFYDVRPADARPVTVMGIAAETAADQFLTAGNYLFVIRGYKAKPEEFSHLFATVPNYGGSPLPTLPKYMPAGAQPNSERYLMGPDALAHFAPAIPPATAAFHFSAEGELAAYGSKGRETTLVLFRYPALEMARTQLPEFRKIPGAVVKRAGPLVAVALGAPSPDDAERLLSQVRYEATITVQDPAPRSQAAAANLFINAFLFCGVLIVFMLISGLIVGGFRILLRRGGASGEGDAMISLHLSGRP